MKSTKSICTATLLTNIGDYQEDWVKVYIEPNNAYSDCGGRITVNIGDDYIGSYFFSNCGTETFEQFIGKVGYDYLINKLFQTQNYIDVESGDELFQSLLDNEILYRVKDARTSGLVSKNGLRELYEELKDREFRDIGELLNMLDSSECETMAMMFNDEWFYNGNFKKRNRVYDRQKAAILAVIDHFGSEACQ